MEQRTLSSARVPDDAEELAAFDLDVEIFECHEFSESRARNVFVLLLLLFFFVILLPIFICLFRGAGREPPAEVSFEAEGDLTGDVLTLLYDSLLDLVKVEEAFDTLQRDDNVDELGEEEGDLDEWLLHDCEYD